MPEAIAVDEGPPGSDSVVSCCICDVLMRARDWKPAFEDTLERVCARAHIERLVTDTNSSVPDCKHIYGDMYGDVFTCMLRIERLAKVTNSSAPIVSFSSDSPLLLGTELRRDRGKYGFQERWVESDGDGETDRQGEIGGERERNREREREREGGREKRKRGRERERERG